MKEILLVEDDRGLSDGIVLSFRQDPYRLTQCYSMEEALLYIRMGDFSLILLDLSLPDGSGFDLLRQLRRAVDTPVILLADKALDMDHAEGYRLGADDCIQKPFAFAQLREKVQRVWKQRRREPGREYCFDSLTLEFDEGRFFKDSQEVRLNNSEQKLLRSLVESRGKVLSLSDLTGQLRNVREPDPDSEREVEGLITSLRRKLETEPERPRLLHTVYGRGYIWKELA